MQRGSGNHDLAGDTGIWRRAEQVKRGGSWQADDEENLCSETVF